MPDICHTLAILGVGCTIDMPSLYCMFIDCTFISATPYYYLLKHDNKTKEYKELDDTLRKLQNTRKSLAYFKVWKIQQNTS